ncbi:hypothetical protein N5T57_10205 [Aliarcobacter cryaerophilus]|uniref:hypothetical protein n=1 Tax=Aliarcobacter cryaerophilus TaxID=28198 RepID=UPI0021B2EC5E|nr:hypothetical protein [Aliarcobacter cryaerophilus]MCT7523297.1 hypothetical protein [Aliarcobacter cryaerophilus]
MRTQAMIYSIKDSLFVIILGAIFYGGFIYVKSTYGRDMSDFVLLVGFFILTAVCMNILCALGESIFSDSSYDTNKNRWQRKQKEYIFSLFKTGKIPENLMYMFSSMFFMLIGLFTYPIAVMVSLFNLKEFNAKREKVYDEVSESKLENTEIIENEPVKENSEKKSTKSDNVEPKEKRVGHIHCFVDSWDCDVKIFINFDGKEYFCNVGKMPYERRAKTFDSLVAKVEEFYKNNKKFKIKEIKKY